mgnify:CR=1 FL=1
MFWPNEERIIRARLMDIASDSDGASPTRRISPRMERVAHLRDYLASVFTSATAASEVDHPRRQCSAR